MEELLQIWREAEEYAAIRGAVKAGQAASLTGLPPAAKAAFAAALYSEARRPSLILTAQEDEARAVYENIRPFLGEEALYFPVMELLPFEVCARNIELNAERIAVLSALSRGKRPLVVAGASAILRRLPPADIFAGEHISIGPGSVIRPAELAARLAEMGYERSRLTEIPGSFSLRGSIVDIFPITALTPSRLEFFDDELESIRYFDPASQLSAEALPELLIPPGRELPLSPEVRVRAAKALDKEMEQMSRALVGPAKRQLRETFGPVREYLDRGIWQTGMESLLTYFYPEAGSLLDYLPKDDCLLMLSEPGQIKELSEQQQRERELNYYDMLESGKLLPSFYHNFLGHSQLQEQFAARRPILLNQLESGPSGLDVGEARHIKARDLPSYAHDPKQFTIDCRHFAAERRRVFISASSETRLKRVNEIIRDAGFPAVRILRAAFNKGYDSESLKLALITEQELFAQEGKRKARRLYHGGGKIESFLDLQPGDHVVHITQGIGRYIGVERLTVEEISRDYLLIMYAGDDKLYLPVDQLDLIQKYIGNEGAAPRLYKLGGGEWQRVKARVRASVRDMARELLQLYAARAAARGFALSADSNWQREFEDAFPYEETPDQLQAIEDIKDDMESVKVMDRLLCGDVGYGKTEIALRAAFKAVMDGKQVALLAPTTVLAQQHQRTITERFAGYPLRLGCLSRFATPTEQKKLVNALAAGEIDIMVGTHRLLSADVRYKDLGLLIVDEEQRFGVAHKEKIKSMRGNVDVLTLSATPIPRTLHMALTGMRDMSIIATPPQDRRPVQTYVLEYQERLIREAVLRELARGGQVYFVHNRVHNIYERATALQQLLPKARIAVAHGQMREKELECVMMEFVEEGADILLCTTIIESGLDIPNVNTLIVDEADHFGLSQLYQLRGRVGRSERQAFAYFTYRRDKAINETAQKRLIAIRDFTELGAGFKIAMRDLELRGAGNILGPEQSGHIMAVGFDLYCRLLKEEMAIQAGQAPVREEAISAQMELQLNAFIPNSYIEDSGLKVEVYKRVAACESLGEVDDLAAVLIDRYGSLPAPLNNLLLLGKVKALAKQFEILSIIQKPAHIELKFAEGHPLTGKHLLRLLVKWEKRLAFADKKSFSIRLHTGDIVQGVSRVELLLKLLVELEETVKSA
ncbi:MAG: transcription-repair coupling factor [Clostridiales bacterium]|nr:transcription-repair coupling factor [Clostridiales bacterium]